MAGIFRPEVYYERPVEMTSAASTLFDLGAQLVKSAAPTAAERRAASDSKALSGYAQEVDDIQQKLASGQLSQAAASAAFRKVDIDYLSKGIDISGPEFKAARSSITGRAEEDFGLTENEILLNDLRSTPEGQSELIYAAGSLQAKGIVNPSEDQIAAEYFNRQNRKLALEDSTVIDQFTFRQAKPAMLDRISLYNQDLQTSVKTLTDAGVSITAPMVQNEYLRFLNLREQLVSRIPANVPEADRAEVEKQLGRTEEFFKQLGMSVQNGEVQIVGRDELALTVKIQTYVKALAESTNAADNILAMQIMEDGYKVDPVQFGLIESRFAALDTAIEFPDMDQVLSQDILGTYSAFAAAEVDTGIDIDKATQGAISLVPEDQREMWLGMSNADGWKATKAFGAVSKGWSPQAIQSGKMLDGAFNNLAGLALSFESIDINQEPVSFNGVRSEVSAELPRIIRDIKAIDAVRGSALEAMMFRSLVTQKVAYDKRIQSDEKAIGIVFDPNRRVYNISTNTTDPSKLATRFVVDNVYGGSLSAALQDKFKKVKVSDLPDFYTEGFDALATSGQVLTTFQSQANGAVSEEDLRMILDMRSSSVYLSRLSSQIEPEQFQQAREDTPTASVTLNLIDRYEAGEGGYNALFGQSQNDQFSNIRVSELTLGELYDFADPNGAYGQFVKNRNPRGVVSTPMGRYQFVGRTLRDVARRMGLPDDTVFTPDVQDRMFLFHAQSLLSNRTRQADKRDVMRRTWEGLQNATDRELDAMVAEIESGNVPFAEDRRITETTLPPAPASRPSVVEQTRATLGATPQPTPQAAPAEAPQGQATAEAMSMPEEILQRQERERQTPELTIPAEIRNLIEQLGGNPNTTVVVKDREEVQQLIKEGKLKEGDLFVVEGTIQVVTSTMSGVNKQFSQKVQRQLRRLGIDKNNAYSFNSDEEALQAIAEGEIGPGDAYVLPDDSVRVVED